MDGFHDLGGFQGFGKVPHTINSLSYQPVFKQDWEHLAYSLMFVGADHLKSSAWTKCAMPWSAWMCANMSAPILRTLCHRDRHPAGRNRCDHPGGTRSGPGVALQAGEPAHANGRPAITGRAPFEVGDRVVVRDDMWPGIPACRPTCAAKKAWLCTAPRKVAVPDAIGHGDLSAAHQPTYHVEFRVKDLWGDAADEGFVVVDLFESYLDHADSTVNA